RCLQKKTKAGPGRSKKPKDSKQSAHVTEESQDDSISQLLGVTIAAINATKDLVPIDLAKGILRTIANILTLAQSVIKNKSDFQAIADKSVNRINSDVASSKEQGLWRRLFSDLDRVLGLFNFEAIAGMGIDMKLVKKALELIGNNPSINVPKNRQIKPPSRPAMLYGRDDLVAELTNLVVNDEHLALIGPGGMGKSSVAKAIINEPLVIKKFADRRFFVTYDDLDPSIITFETFMTRFARALGIEIAGSDPVRQISSFLDSACALLVLDNAETFEEASASSALRDIPPAIAKITSVPGVILILTSRSRRNAPNVRWITKDILPLDLSSAQVMFFQIYQCASRSEAEEDIKGLLKELDFHPLSINILANAAQQNGCKVLDGGKGKLQSLSDTMQLSLSSPSVQNLGKYGLRALAIIVFLPQGLNEDLASDLLPSLPQVDAICDVLCMQSLVYRQDNFFKMLAPIRHYMRDSLQAPDPTCLQEIRAFYYRTVRRCSDKRDSHADIIISDHLNIEHVVAVNLAHIQDDKKETYDICWRFLWCLMKHLPRPTTLTSAISNIVENSSMWTLKANCLLTLAQLYTTLSQLVEASQAYQAAEALYLTAGDPERMGHCLISRASLLWAQGRFIQSQNLLEDLQHSDSWHSLSETMKAKAWYFFDNARMYTFTASADELFVKSMEDPVWGLASKIWHWLAKFYHGGDVVQVKTHLKDLSMQHAGTGDTAILGVLLQGLADIAYCEGRLSEAMDIVQKIIGMDGQSAGGVLWYTVWKAHVVSKQGDYNLARELVLKAFESFQFFSLRNSRTFLHQSYGSACIELTAGECDRAETYFTTTIEACDIQSNLLLKTCSIRGLGEIAFARRNFALATQRFEETRSLCAEMGVPPKHLYSFSPFSTLPDRFEGWALFLEGQSPFADVM
ncbi:hypothetical protein DFJ58DRAFT_808404, partial [Suillus subalutaceus]|uniref:uncharacterized protein n=1 Tax=Suillus subalutaceus TaxID=48586 RepID=UPI001B880D96